MGEILYRHLKGNTEKYTYAEMQKEEISVMELMI